MSIDSYTIKNNSKMSKIISKKLMEDCMWNQYVKNQRLITKKLKNWRWKNRKFHKSLYLKKMRFISNCRFKMT